MTCMNPREKLLKSGKIQGKIREKSGNLHITFWWSPCNPSFQSPPLQLRRNDSSRSTTPRSGTPSQHLVDDSDLLMDLYFKTPLHSSHILPIPSNSSFYFNLLLYSFVATTVPVAPLLAAEPRLNTS